MHQWPLIEHSAYDDGDSTLSEDQRVWDSLPASYLTAEYDLASPLDNMVEFLQLEFDLGGLGHESVLDKVVRYKIPTPCIPLHNLASMDGGIAVTELMDSHLAWWRSTIYIKPLPRYLLLASFWRKYLTCERGRCACNSAPSPCLRQQLHAVAVGFIYSYAALIAYEVDFVLAKEKGLLPREDALTWTAWTRFVRQLLVRGQASLHHRMHRRFRYGDIALDMRSVVSDRHRFFRGPTLRWFDAEYLRCIVVATVFLALILTAMQVGLAVEIEASAFRIMCVAFSLSSIIVAVGWFSIAAGEGLWIHGRYLRAGREARAKRLHHLQQKYGVCF